MPLVKPWWKTPRNKLIITTLPKYIRLEFGVNEKLQDYLQILDSVYEMADMVMTSNGISAEKAVVSVLHGEGWFYQVDADHRKMIINKLKEE